MSHAYVSYWSYVHPSCAANLQNPLGTRSELIGTDMVNYAQTGADKIIGLDLSQHVAYNDRPSVRAPPVRLQRGSIK